MNVLHVVPSFYPATHWGGPIHSVLGLCRGLAREPDLQLKVLTTDTAGVKLHQRLLPACNPTQFPDGFSVLYCRRMAGISIAPGLVRQLFPAVGWADVVHLTAVYSFPTLPTLLVSRLFGKPVVWSPRGALQRWEGTRKPRLKWLWNKLCGRLLARDSCIVHVTSDLEFQNSRVFFPDLRYRIIANGVEIPEPPSARSWRPQGALRLLYMGRLDVKKGLENLFTALAEIEKCDWSLTVCGSGNAGYEEKLKLMTRNLGIAARVAFLGHIDGEEKTRAYEGADISVVPSHVENFGQVIAEALAHGVPVIASKGTPWSDLEPRGCGLWVDASPAELASAIRRLSGADLAAMGKRGREWMRESFSWTKIAREMAGAYSSLVNQDHAAIAE